MAEGQQLKAVTIKRGKDAPVAMSIGVQLLLVTASAILYLRAATKYGCMM